MSTKSYTTDLTDDQWALIKPLIPPARPGGRPRTADMRGVIDAIFYLTRNGCQWRDLPAEFPKWRTVYNYFRYFSDDGTWEEIQRRLRKKVRRKAGRKGTPTAGSIDSQSVKTAEGGEAVGNDGGKLVHGRKRHILVDTLGLLLAVVVTAASADDGTTAPLVFESYRGWGLSRLRVIWADIKYHNYSFLGWIGVNARFALRIVLKREGQEGFEPLPRRWVAERTFAWLGRCRRLSKDYERLTQVSESMVRVASIQQMTRRLTRAKPASPFRYKKAA